jgi:hypothetical protein
MKLPIKLLIFASSGLFSYNSAASLFETTNNPTHKSEDLKTAPSISNNALSNQYITNYFSGSETATMAFQLPKSKRTDWLYNTLKLLQLSDTNIANPDTNDPRLNQDSVDLSESLASQEVEDYKIEDIPFRTIPLPAAIWLFLGGLLGFLRIQRTSK